MKENLINILEYLVKFNSWDLAWDILNWIKNIENIKPRYIVTIINFLENELNKSKDNNKIKQLIKAKNKLKLIKNIEMKEKQEEINKLENLIFEF